MGGVQHTFNHLPQAHKHPPTTARRALVKILNETEVLDGVSVYDHDTGDTLTGGDNREVVREVSSQVWDTLTSLRLELPPAQHQGPSQEMPFSVGWWLGEPWLYLSVHQKKTRAGKAPENKKKLQQILETLGYWQKHVPGVPIFAQPLHNLVKKNAQWH